MIWGTGNFERDDALNVLDHIISDILDNIREVLSYDTTTTLFRDLGEAWIVGHIDILCILLETYKAECDLDTPTVLRWKEVYLDTYDRTIHHYSKDADYIVQRRRVVVNTFDKLVKLVQSFDND